MNIVIIILFSLLYVILRLIKNMHMLQQNFYNENNRYIKWGLKNITNVFRLDIILLVVNIINLFINNKYLIYVNVLYILLFIYEYNVKKKEQVKIPLKITSRVKRMFITYTLLMILPIILNLLFIKNDYMFNYIYSLLITLSFFLVFLVNVINAPIEKIVFNYYKTKAKNKLKALNLEVIGITGSYGKTSSKNILNDILSVKFNSATTPKNFNTKYGLMITINNYLDKFDDIFIAEMGAFKRGSIKALCDLVKPKYGIITNIGRAHLETFGSQENIQKGKFELVESLPEDGMAILNKDDPLQVSYKIKNKCKVIWIAIDNKEADLVASNIKMNSSGMSFDVYFKELNKKHKFNTKLLGKPNVYNILSALAFGLYKGMTLEELEVGVKKVKTIEHRLELKKFEGKVFIDDAYNSNPVGSKMALDVLNLMNGLKIVVTPGMIELGDEQYSLNKQFGEYISEVADYVILVGKNQTKPIQDGLKSKKYDEKKLFIINDVKEAFKIVDGIKSNKTKYVLLENDLPDIFNE